MSTITHGERNVGLGDGCVVCSDSGCQAVYERGGVGLAAVEEGLASSLLGQRSDVCVCLLAVRQSMHHNTCVTRNG